MKPSDIRIEGFLSFPSPGNCFKRVEKINRLAAAVGAVVYYGLGCPLNSVEYLGDYFEARGLRQTESLLRYLKRQK